MNQAGRAGVKNESEGIDRRSRRRSFTSLARQCARQRALVECQLKGDPGGDKHHMESRTPHRDGTQRQRMGSRGWGIQRQKAYMARTAKDSEGTEGHLASGKTQIAIGSMSSFIECRGLAWVGERIGENRHANLSLFVLSIWRNPLV